MPRVNFTDQELTDFWRSVIDPRNVGMAEAIAAEIGAYTNESTADVLRKMASGEDDFNDLWHQTKPSADDENSLTAFYRDQFIEAYELANWHCGRTKGTPPLHYPRAALLAKEWGLRRVLDFGSGIGTGSVALASVGCEVHSADIARRLLDFVDFRLKARGFVPHLIDLAAGEKPRRSYYDLITCFDVLEHVPDQLAKVRELITYLAPGGYLLVNFFRDAITDEHAMHVSSAGNWLRLVRKTPLIPKWESFGGEVEVLRHASYGRVYNTLASIRDRVQGL
jgi:2-polyprenyl-3-methyl-5-hydroxy-6-metoxy-1,4-benzoquinol methylase